MGSFEETKGKRKEAAGDLTDPRARAGRHRPAAKAESQQNAAEARTEASGRKRRPSKASKSVRGTRRGGSPPG